MSDVNSITEELKSGGEWLGAARTWMQSNIREGDTLVWSSPKTVEIRFKDLEDFALTVAAAAVAQERKIQDKMKK